MNFVFETYPSHPWFADWTFEPRDCKASFRETGSARFFKTLDTVGRVGPNTEDPDWAAQIPVPQNSRVNLLFNGFCAYHQKKGARVGAEAITPEPGVLWGRTSGVPAPVLASERAIAEHDGYQWLESEHGVALLMSRGDLFCLVTKSVIKEEAARIAEEYLDRDFPTLLNDELERRSGAKELFAEMAHHDALAVISAESVMKSLRPAEGKIPLSWCQASGETAPRMDVNELRPLAMAWRLMNPEIAEELVLCALKTQTNAGAIAVQVSPHGPSSVMEAPKPLLAKTVETIWETRENKDFLAATLPLLRRHIQWLLHHFDPKRQGTHVWKNKGEPLIPSLFQTDLATVDLSIMLITEIDAFHRLNARGSATADGAEAFATERAALERNILEVFWNPRERSFTNAILRGQPAEQRGFSTFTPLLWSDLSHDHREAILDRARQSGKLPGGVSVLSWRKSAMDDDSFPLIQQQFVFDALRVAAPHGQLLNDFSRVTLQGFVEWHSLALEKENRLRVNPVTCAFIMNVQALRQYRYHAKGGLSKKIFGVLRRNRTDRLDLAILAATIFAALCVHLIYKTRAAPPPLDLLEARMNAAYVNGNYQETYENCVAIMKFHPDQADLAMLLAANVAMFAEELPRATELYERVRERHIDSPGPMIALGLAYQLQGRFKEAESTYHEFCYIFDEIFPELVDKVLTFRYLAREGLASPPKWREIYRYPIMHEVDF